MAEDKNIYPVNIEEEMKSAYIDYSMSVIVSRALPDVRDGLKPVHRRVLYGMQGLGLTHSKSHKKSARIVGEVLGKYHPHGDTSVYDSMVRMAQSWSLRYPLVDGQGNFGSVDGDSPAAMRYTEARLESIADEILTDINKDTVDFSNNFDDSLKEPTVLPTKIPNLLVNGASGIAVGMATNMLPHNLTEVINGITETIDNPEITIDELMQFIKAPDFPTGGILYGIDGVKEAFRTGRGRVVLRAKVDIEVKSNDREVIIVTEIPYQVNKANLIIKIAELVNDKKIEGISDVRDESDRKGMRIVVEVRKDAMANVVLSKLYKYTALQSSYGVNNVALVNGRPYILNLKQLIEEFIKFRLEVVVRRTQYDLKKAQERAHILEGLLIALDNLDAVIKLIRASKTVEEARVGLMSNFSLSEIQAKAILDMRLQKLTGLEIDKIQTEYDELMIKIAHFEAILASIDMQKDIVKEELAMVKDKYGDERKTEITFADGEISIEDMIADDEVIVSISRLGYIKRTKSSDYKVQGRGGKGSRGSKTRDKDYIEHLFMATNHNYLLLFSDKGRCYWLRVYEIPEANKTSMGRVINNLVHLPKGDKIMAYIKVQDLKDAEFNNANNIIFCSKNGVIKRTSLEAFSRPRTNGVNAITIREGDELLDAQLTNGSCDIILGSKAGLAIRFPEGKVRIMGRSAAGVTGMRLRGDGDSVIGMVAVVPTETVTLLVLSSKGNGKRSLLDEYRLTNRGGKGVKTMNITEKTGELVAIKNVTDDQDLMISTISGIFIRLSVAKMRTMGRATQGVKLINLGKKDAIADVALVPHAEVDDIEDIEIVEGDEKPNVENDISDEGANEEE